MSRCSSRWPSAATMRLRSSPSAAADSSGSRLRPRPARLAARDEPPEEVGPRRVERGVDVVERSRQRAEAVARVERRALAEEAVELEVGEDRLQHERPDVEASRELVVGDGELRADIVGEDVVEQAGDRLAGGRVAEGEVLERRDVVLAGEELADCRLAVAAGPADLLRVRLEALRQVEVVDVADVGLVDAHAERDRRDDDVAGRCRPPLLRRDAVLGGQAGVVRAGGQPGRRRAARRRAGPCAGA